MSRLGAEDLAVAKDDVEFLFQERAAEGKGGRVGVVGGDAKDGNAHLVGADASHELEESNLGLVVCVVSS